MNNSFLLTLPIMWIRQFKSEELRDLDVFVDEKLNLVIKMNAEKQKEE